MFSVVTMASFITMVSRLKFSVTGQGLWMYPEDRNKLASFNGTE